MPTYTCPKCDSGVTFRREHQVPRQIKCPSCHKRFPAKGNKGDPHGLPHLNEDSVEYSGGSISFKMVGVMFLVLFGVVLVIILLNHLSQ